MFIKLGKQEVASIERDTCASENKLYEVLGACRISKSFRGPAVTALLK